MVSGMTSLLTVHCSFTVDVVLQWTTWVLLLWAAAMDTGTTGIGPDLAPESAGLLGIATTAEDPPADYPCTPLEAAVVEEALTLGSVEWVLLVVVDSIAVDLQWVVDIEEVGAVEPMMDLHAVDMTWHAPCANFLN